MAVTGKEEESGHYAFCNSPEGKCTAAVRLLINSSAQPGGCGVGVGSPLGPYVSSIAVRIAFRGLPSACIAITSRVMFRQMSQRAPWLVKVTAPSGCRSAT
jgi:hypothetical protein